MVRDTKNLTFAIDDHADYLHISALCSTVVCTNHWQNTHGTTANSAWNLHRQYRELRGLSCLAREGRSRIFLFCYNLSCIVRTKNLC